MLEIRTAQEKDLPAIARLEARAFPEDEAASEQTLKERLQVYPNHFWLLFRDGRLVSMVEGMVSSQDELSDEMYENTSLHDESGRWQMLFGVCTDPDARGKGYASILMKEVAKDCLEDSRAGIVLNCKDEYIPFYEKLGFVKAGDAASTHAGKHWNRMVLNLE